jgi:tRNA(adenine34) deaminase
MKSSSLQTILPEDHRWMQHALQLAKRAEQQGEVPIGAVLVLNNEIIGEGYNQTITHHDPTAHAEIVALRDAGKKLGNYRLLNSTLYVTLEPCLMCVGAIVHARCQRLVYGADDPKAGAVSSVFNILQSQKLNHAVECMGGVLAEECGQLLKNFFLVRRS